MFIIGLDPGVHAPFAQSSVEVNRRALVALFTKAGRPAPNIVVSYFPQALGAPVAAPYTFQPLAPGGPLFNAEVGGKLVQIRGPLGASFIPVLIASDLFPFTHADGGMRTADGITIHTLSGFALATGIAGGNAGNADIGLYRNRHLLAHELGHVVGYAGDHQGHANAANHVMYFDGVSDRPDVVADDEYLDLVAAWLNRLPPAAIA